MPKEIRSTSMKNIELNYFRNCNNITPTTLLQLSLFPCIKQTGGEGML